MGSFFLNPWALALAGLAGGIVLLYILKLRRKKLTVGSTLLWETILVDSRANAPWQKLRRNLLMLLQILALLLLAVALARPFLFGTSIAGGRRIILLDTSASMNATDGGPSRLRGAISEANRIVASMKPSEEAMVMSAGPDPRVLSGFTHDKPQLYGALKQVEALAGGEADINSALKLASSIASGNKTRVIIFSDGAVEEIDPLATVDLDLSFFPLGEAESDNLAIVGASASRDTTSDTYQVFAAVRSFSPRSRRFDLSFEAADGPIDVRSIELGPGKREDVLLTGLPYIDGPIKVSIDDEDMLADDNTAYIVMPERSEFRVGYARSGESVLLTRALGSIPNIRLFVYQNGAYETEADLTADEQAGDVKIDVWIVEGAASAPYSSSASYLYINSGSGDALPVETGPEIAADYSADPPVLPAVVGAVRTHPLLSYVNMSTLRLKTMREVALKPWARTVVESNYGPLIAEGELNGQRSLYFAFDLYESDLPLKAAFPVLMANCIRYLGEASTGAAGRTNLAGRRIELTAPPEAVSAEMRAPDGAQTAVEVRGRRATLGSALQPGVYEVAYSDEDGKALGTKLVPVSLLSALESDLTPRTSLSVLGADEALAATGAEGLQEIQGRREIRVNREFYIWLILLVLLIMGVEWYLYHTRSF